MTKLTSRLARAAAPMALVLGWGCAKVVVEERDAFCVHWHEIDVAPGPDAIPPALACEVMAQRSGADVVPPPASEARLTYVCVPATRAGTCAPPSGAESMASECLESKVGDLCNGRGHIGGSCTTVSIWSMCGPDPQAEGACCYYAYVVTSTVLSEGRRSQPKTSSLSEICSEDARETGETGA